MKTTCLSQRNWHSSDACSCHFSSGSILHNWYRYWTTFCVWSSHLLASTTCFLLTHRIQVSCWNTQTPDGNVIAFPLWWSWRNKLTHFPFFKALKLPTPAVQPECVLPCWCSSKTKTLARHFRKPVPMLFPTPLCVCWCCRGAFLVACSCSPSCPMGMVPPCHLGSSCCSF